MKSKSYRKFTYVINLFRPMAKTQKDLKGWQYHLDGGSTIGTNAESSTHTRRSRRSKVKNETIIFRRDTDDLQIKVGDSILVQQNHLESSEIALIKEIKFGNDNFIDIIVLWFIRIRDIEFTELPKEGEYSSKDNLNMNELFITAYLEEIQLSEIVDKVNVLSDKEFNSDIVLDDSNTSNTFLCRRGCNSEGDLFTDKFDYTTLMLLFHSDQHEFLEFIRKGTIPVAYASKKTSGLPKLNIQKKIEQIEEKVTESEGPKPLEKEEKELTVQLISDKESEEPLTDDEYNSISEQEESIDEKIESDVDEEFTTKLPSTPSKRKRKSKDQNSPTKQNKTNYVSKIDDESRQYINSMLSPLKKRLKIKQDASKPSLLALSPQKKHPSSSIANSGIDPSSEAFKELKAKLHTSAKISSLPCREDEFTSIYMNLETAIQEESGCCIYVSGTPGVGKTATIREVISQLRSLSDMNELNDFDYLELNGLKLISPNAAYEVLWEKISGLKVSASNAALLLEGYFNQDNNKKPLLVLMDELDQIVTKKQGVMYNFFNWPTYPKSKLIVIAVANTMDLPERVLSNKISSRLGLRRIQFIGYTFEQLGEIIRHRLTMLTKQNKRNVIVSPDAIGFASRKVASVSGDARRALTICRRAVEIAEKEFISKEPNTDDNDTYYVQISHISKAINETVNTPILLFLTNLSFASKLVLVSILLRMKRSGLAVNTLGDIIDEMKNSLALLTSKEGNRALESVDSRVNLVNLLYGNGLIDSNSKLNIRAFGFKKILTELVETGIIMQQNIQSERYRLVNLNVSEAEILTVLKRDKEVSGMI